MRIMKLALAATLGELKQWLDKNEIEYKMYDYEGPECLFTIEKYTVGAVVDSEENDTVVRRFAVQHKIQMD